MAKGTKCGRVGPHFGCNHKMPFNLEYYWQLARHSPWSLVPIVLHVWLLIDALRREEWLWAGFLFFFPGLADVIYFFYVMRAAPSATMGFELPGAHDRRRIKELQAQIHNLDKPHHYLELGDIYFQKGNLQKAEACYRASLERDPRDIDARAHMGQCLLRAQNAAAARPLLEQVCREKPMHDYGHSLMAYAEALAALGETDGGGRGLAASPGKPQLRARPGAVGGIISGQKPAGPGATQVCARRWPMTRTPRISNANATGCGCAKPGGCCGNVRIKTTSMVKRGNPKWPGALGSEPPGSLFDCGLSNKRTAAGYHWDRRRRLPGVFCRIGTARRRGKSAMGFIFDSFAVAGITFALCYVCSCKSAGWRHISKSRQTQSY